MKYIKIITFLVLLTVLSLKSQVTKKVLFIGNSYTAVNNLPSIISSMATNSGDVLMYDSNTPGGFRFLNHASDATTLNKINSNDWDYVVLQAQSQEAALSETQMASEVYPYATSLSAIIRQNNECSQPLFYMTWGRKNGDPGNCPFIPWVCTYEGMDDVIQNSYTFMAEENDAILAPVGAVWRYLRTNNPTIELYAADESHPSIAGSYAAACALYTMIYKKDPTLLTWNSTLSASDANSIKMAAKTVVFDQIAFWDHTIDIVVASFSENMQAGEVSFLNTSANFDTVFWDFGDGNFSTEVNPIHTFAESGSYQIAMTITKCGKSNTQTKTLEITTDLDLSQFVVNKIVVFPNPVENELKVDLNIKFEQCTAELFDTKGAKLYSQQQSESSSIQMNMANLSTGIYFLKVTADQKVFFSKIIKK